MANVKLILVNVDRYVCDNCYFEFCDNCPKHLCGGKSIFARPSDDNVFEFKIKRNFIDEIEDYEEINNK